MNFATCLRSRDFITGNNPQPLTFQWRNTLHGHLEVGLVVRMFGIPTGKRVLQVGCGSGIALLHLSRLCGPRVIVGIDIDSTLLGESADRLRDKRIRAHLVHADVRKMPFPDRSFDLVVDFGVCYHTQYPGDALIEIGRVLDTSGTFVYETPLAQLLAHPRSDRQRLPWEEIPSLIPDRSLVFGPVGGRRVQAVGGAPRGKPVQPLVPERLTDGAKAVRTAQHGACRQGQHRRQGTPHSLRLPGVLYPAEGINQAALN